MTLYESLCGIWPMRGSSLGEICNQVTQAQLVPLRERYPGIDAEICALVDWMLAPLDRRIPSAQLLQTRLETLPEQTDKDYLVQKLEIEHR